MEYRGEFAGAQIVGRDTHYEAHIVVNSQNATLVIGGDIAKEFQGKYNTSLVNASKIKGRANFVRNDRAAKPNRFQSPYHLVGSVESLDDLELIID